MIWRPYQRPTTIGTTGLIVVLIYTLIMSHGSSPPPSNPLPITADAIGTQLRGAITVAYAPGGQISGTVQQAICTANSIATSEVDCTVLLVDQAGSYEITVVSTPQGDWHQLCEPGDLQNGHLCSPAGGSQ